ncbi:uncharacterized protein LOC115971567 [Quercus lobata]|uniref:uncharacterized protein LOC115971567 n=1 Tax=Quercus lobata TaxID=97700 RepID=UPI001244955C|nr:uncharacterized protein LOC115971567 [Quercus lobata]
MSITRIVADDSNSEPKKARMEIRSALSFSDEDKVGTIQPHDDALVVNLRIGDLTSYDSPLVSFDGKVVIPKGQIRLPVQAGSKVVEVDFIVVDAYSPYTAIMARLWLYALGAISSTLHLKVKYPSGDWVEELSKSSALPVDGQANEAKCEDLEKFAIGNDPEKFFQVGAQLPPQEKVELVEFLKTNVDVFAWNAYEAPGVDPSFICHHLNVNPSVTPRKQPPRHSSKDHSDAVRDEVMKFKQARAIKEVFYLEWLANTVVVKKKTGKWRVCVDFTDLNKACPKDPFPIPRIDQLVGTTVGHPRMSFLDAFQGYHQISLALDDQERTTFVTPIGNCHYKVMPFGLKNAGGLFSLSLGLFDLL